MGSILASHTTDASLSPVVSIAGIPWRGFVKELAQAKAVLDTALDGLTTCQKAQALAIKDASIGLETSPDESSLVAKVMGTMKYANDSPLSFDARLRNNDGDWRLVHLDFVAAG
jgi:hypothetical protein